MRAAALLTLAAGLLAGCLGGGPQGPQWQTRAAEAAHAYHQAMLRGDSHRAGTSLSRALEAAGRSSDLRPLARIHLGRVAMQLALRREPKPAAADELVAMADDPELTAYRHFLAGSPEAGDEAHLREPLKAVARHLRQDQPQALVESIRAIDTARTRVVAAAVAHRHYPDRSGLIDTVVATASHQGWRGVLLQWLPLQAEAAEQAGEEAKAESIRQRLRWLRDPLTGQPSGDE